MQNKIIIENFKTAYGELIIGSIGNKLCLCDWRYRKMRHRIDDRIKTGLNAEFIVGKSKIITETKIQLTQYFHGDRSEFDIPLILVGSEFQKKVWNALMLVPYGSTVTYVGLSKSIGNEKANRAVAAANGANAISIIIPCHRIIGNNGELVGYAGGLKVKKELLKLENVLIKSQLEIF
jgi:methylated-DNA-[protein]-cysteine S-methyltransferase